MKKITAIIINLSLIVYTLSAQQGNTIVYTFDKTIKNFKTVNTVITEQRLTFSTACPGDDLYSQLPTIRTSVANYINNGCQFGGSGQNLTRSSDNLSITGSNTVDIDVTMINNGNQAITTNSRVGYYLSTDQNITTSDFYIANDLVSVTINAGGTTSENIVSNVCTLSTAPSNGTYYVGYILDYQNAISETDETDNDWHFSSPQLTVNCPTGQPDYVVVNANVIPSSVAPGGQFDVSCSVLNQGSGDAVVDSDLEYWLVPGTNTSCDRNITTDYLDNDNVVAQTAGSSSSESQTLTIDPSTPDGNYFIMFAADDDLDITESDENNNTSCVPITITSNCTYIITPPNALDLPASGASGSFTVTPSLSTCSWMLDAGTCLSGFTINDLSGTGTVTLNYTVPLNTSAAVQTCTLTVQGTNTSFIVTQLGGPTLISEEPDFINLNIFPNPNNGSFMVQLETQSEEDIQISVLNVLGQVIHKMEPQKIFSLFSKAIEIKDLSTGVYFVRVNIGEETISRKIVIGR